MLDMIDRWRQHFETALPWIPSWAISVGLLALALAIAYFAHKLFFRSVTRIVADKDLFWRSLVARTHGVTRLAAMIMATSVAAEIAPLTDPQLAVIRHVLTLASITLIGWVALTALHI